MHRDALYHLFNLDPATGVEEEGLPEFKDVHFQTDSDLNDYWPGPTRGDGQSRTGQGASQGQTVHVFTTLREEIHLSVVAEAVPPHPPSLSPKLSNPRQRPCQRRARRSPRKARGSFRPSSHPWFPRIS